MFAWLTLTNAMKLAKNPWTWRVIAVLAIAGALGYARHHYIKQGAAQGAEQQKSDTQQEIERQRKLADADTNAKIADADARAAVAKQKQADAELKVAQDEITIRSLSNAMVTARATVQALPDSSLHGYIRGKLGVLPATDPRPEFTATEERALADTITQAPLLQQKVTAQERALADLQDDVKSLKEQQAAARDRSAARDAYLQQLTGWYTQLYNLHPPKARKAKCLWIWRCGENKLGVPAPKELK